MLRPIRLQCDGAWILSGLLCIYLRSSQCVHLIPICAKSDQGRTFRNGTTWQVQECLQCFVLYYIVVGSRRLVPPDALQPKAYCTNPGLYSFLLVSTRDPSSERRNYLGDEFCLKMPDFHVTFRDILHAVNLRHVTNGFTSLPKEGVLRIFHPEKSDGFGQV